MQGIIQSFILYMTFQAWKRSKPEDSVTKTRRRCLDMCLYKQNPGRFEMTSSMNTAVTYGARLVDKRTWAYSLRKTLIIIECHFWTQIRTKLDGSFLRRWAERGGQYFPMLNSVIPGSISAGVGLGEANNLHRPTCFGMKYRDSHKRDEYIKKMSGGNFTESVATDGLQLHDLFSRQRSEA